MKRISTILSAPLLLLLAACQPAEETRVPEAPLAGDTQPVDEGAVCLRGEQFVAEGSVAARSAGPADADRVGALRWQAYEGCERFVVDLRREDGTPADRAGEVTVEVLRHLGVVRVSLPDVDAVEAEATEIALEGPLARAAYAVRSPIGRGLYVDLHLAEAAEAHVTTLDEPARVVVDLRPGGPPVPEPAPAGDHVVVLEPRPGRASYPLRVTGYARTFESNVVVRLERNGETVHEDFTTATGWVDAWGHYSLSIPRGPAGRVVLHVGEYSAKDGTWQGVAIDLHVR
jgi:hypothetical protein